MVFAATGKRKDVLKEPSLYSHPHFHFPELKDDKSMAEISEKTTSNMATDSPVSSKPDNKKPRSRTPVTLKDLKIELLQRIFANLLVSDTPLVLKIVKKPSKDRNNPSLAVLRTCSLFSQVGIPLLYGANTITSSSPATSKDFDKHLLSLPGRNRQLIKHVKLQIDWAGELWAHFPLIARVLGEIVGLKSLEIEILGPIQGVRAEAMLTIERKHVLTLVTEDLKALKMFQLKGFSDEKFAKRLEKWVAGGRKTAAKL